MLPNLEVSFSLPIWLVFHYHTAGIISIILNSFGLYLVLFKGNKIDSFKHFLLVFQIFCTITDIHMTFLMQPIPLFPMYAGYCNGVLAMYFGVDPHLLMSIVLWIIASQVNALVACFIRKHQAIAKIGKVHKLPRYGWVIAILLLIIIPIVISTTFQTAGMPVENRMNYVRQTVPSLEPSFILLPNFGVYQFNNAWIITLLLIFIVNTICINLITFLTLQMSKILKSYKNKISAVNYAKHRSAINSLTAQFATSFICIIPPLIMAFNLIVEYKHSQVVAEILLAIFCTHSSINVIVMIATFPPYRNFVLQNTWSMWREDKKSKRSISVVVSTEQLLGNKF